MQWLRDGECPRLLQSATIAVRGCCSQVLQSQAVETLGCCNPMQLQPAASAAHGCCSTTLLLPRLFQPKAVHVLGRFCPRLLQLKAIAAQPAQGDKGLLLKSAVTVSMGSNSYGPQTTQSSMPYVYDVLLQQQSRNAAAQRPRMHWQALGYIRFSP